METARPRLRGASHQWALVASIPPGIALVAAAEGTVETVAAAVFATSVATMLGLSALYHRVTWSPERRLWMRRVDHAGIYGLIAGTYTPVGLLVLEGTWRSAVLSIVWGGAVLAIALKLFWVAAPKWLSAVIASTLGWIGVVVYPQLVREAGVLAAALVLAGGLLYTAGAVVYVRRRPNPRPAVFGYHEVFHLLVVAAVALQFAAIALIVRDA